MQLIIQLDYHGHDSVLFDEELEEIIPSEETVETTWYLVKLTTLALAEVEAWLFGVQRKALSDAHRFQLITCSISTIKRNETISPGFSIREFAEQRTKYKSYTSAIYMLCQLFLTIEFSNCIM